jgi:peptidoglycan-associated lipoprotein
LREDLFSSCRPYVSRKEVSRLLAEFNRRRQSWSKVPRNLPQGGISALIRNAYPGRSAGFSAVFAPEIFEGVTMIKKALCLMAALVLVSACDTTGDGSGNGSANGGANGAMGAARPGTQEDMVVNVGDRVFFAYDKSDLSAEARATLDRQAAWLKKYASANVTVEGHCDERGTREYNLALGERRATAVKNYLVADGIGSSRVKTISYGKERPAVIGSNEAAWAQNRRGVTVVGQ